MPEGEVMIGTIYRFAMDLLIDGRRGWICRLFLCWGGGNGERISITVLDMIADNDTDSDESRIGLEYNVLSGFLDHRMNEFLSLLFHFLFAIEATKIVTNESRVIIIIWGYSKAL
jgi:hypothetical protein